MTMDSRKLGESGEEMACDYLRNKGFKILDRNFKTKLKSGPLFGEIDIVAKKDKTIHFVEVKAARQNNDFMPARLNFAEQNFGGPEDRVNFQKQRKLIKLVQIWLSQKKISVNSKYQIDIIGIKYASDSENPEIRYFENAVSDLA